MKTFWSLFRILLIALLAWYLLEKLSPTETGSSALIETPVLAFVWLGIILFMIAIEISVASLRKILFYTLNEEAKEKYLDKEQAQQEKWTGKWKKIYSSLTDSKPVEKEGEILLDHEYDGIKELDNNLPPWWLYGFYLTIIFAVIYMVRFHLFDGPTQEDEYRQEMAQAAKDIEEYKKTAKDLVDASSVVVLTDAADLSAGKTIFDSSCAVCHRADGGGGIGPNLTDDYWILGGTISDIFTVISEGGRPGKGMIAWKNDLSPLQIAQVSSYITTMYHTNPPDAKEPEGDFYAPDDAGENLESSLEEPTDDFEESEDSVD